MTVSVVLGLSVCFLWARSYQVSDALRWSGRRYIGYAIVYSGKGGLLVGVSGQAQGFAPGIRYDRELDPDPASSTKGLLFSWLGFGLSHELPPYDVAANAVWVPDWFVALLLLTAPVLYLNKRRTIRHREQTGLCGHCGYDLRATAERCPECGTFAGQSAAA